LNVWNAFCVLSLQILEGFALKFMPASGRTETGRELTKDGNPYVHPGQGWYVFL